MMGTYVFQITYADIVKPVMNKTCKLNIVPFYLCYSHNYEVNNAIYHSLEHIFVAMVEMMESI
jgi:hypothetical protein